MDKAVDKKGLQMAILLRMCPLMPLTVLNYLLSLTNIRIEDYIIAMVGTIPIIMIFVYIGTTLSSIQDVIEGNYNKGSLTLILIIGGTIIGLVGVFFIGKTIKSYIEHEI
jgi:uncharacterized membrane protein YdjX (TVP38/TMEM64 family)